MKTRRPTTARPFAVCLLLLVWAAGCFDAAAQTPAEKDDLTPRDREEWRRVLRWPDEREEGFREAEG